ncbi:MAG: sigma-70 family RNA polymerase sigma factor [Leptolyngbya sp. SIO3F4]|nr:sigma-70 family RNA polymerase sigma factor [Leptolyngbya sp. SIO3F4]
MNTLTAPVCNPPLAFATPVQPITSNPQPDFWPIWLQHQSYLSNRCLQWMGGNRANAEEALSNAMLKAQTKWPQYADTINNPKAWLTRLTHNLCVDLHRTRRREPIGVDNFEEVVTDGISLTDASSPKTTLLKQELITYLHQIIAELPPRLNQPFVLKILQGKSYKDISQQLSISEANARKRIQQARTILRKQLKQYLAGLSTTSIIPIES